MRKMKIIYSEHAKDKIGERKISRKTIELAISKPDKILESRFNRRIIHKFVRNKLLRIVLKHENDVFIIITAYYTKPERYR